MPRRLMERYREEILDGLDQTSAGFPEVVCLDVTNAARWFYEESGKEEWDHEEDFPCLVSPWPMAWLEFAMTGIISDTTGIAMGREITSVGLLICTDKIDEDLVRDHKYLASDPLGAHFLKIAGANPNAADRQMRLENLRKAQQSGRTPTWIQIMRITFECRRRLYTPIVRAWYLDEFGKAFAKLAITMSLPTEANLKILSGLGEGPFEQSIRAADAAHLPFWFALSLMHCKNVTLVDMLVPDKVRAARAKKGYEDILYKTLIVEPMRKQVRNEAEVSGQNQIALALHIVRGHFKDYREGAGLFGRVHGMWWWDMHARGDLSQGVIKKDYEIGTHGLRSGATS